MGLKEKIQYRPDIDGLPAIAILAVVAFHASIPGFTGGFVGVDIFFALSGFLITQILLLELRNTGKISFSGFYSRRMRRLLPALLVVIATTVLLDIFLTPGLGNSRKFAASVRWTTFGFANVFFKRNTGGYFDGVTAEMPLLHCWSLGVEEQFYLLWPLLLSITHRLWTGKGKLLLGILTGVSLITSIFAIHRGASPSAFYLMPYRAWELGVGALLAYGGSTDRFKLPRWAPNLIAGVGFTLVITPIFLYTSATPFPGWSAIPPVLGTALLIGAGRPANNLVSQCLSSKPLVWLGSLSYGWYLWHWPLLVLTRLWNLGQEPSLPIRISSLLISLVLAQLSLIWIEAPIRFGNRWARMPPRQVITTGFALSAVLCLTGFGIVMAEDRVLANRLGAGIVSQVRETSPLAGKCFTQNEVGSLQCTLSYANGIPPLGTIAVWGDSHAGSYFPLAEAFAREKNLAITQYCQGQTPPLLTAAERVDFTALAPSVFGTFSEAVIWDLNRKVQATRPAPVSVILASRWILYTGKPTIDRKAANFPRLAASESASIEILKDRLKTTLNELDRIEVHRVLILLPYPEFPFFILRCLERGIASCGIAREDLEAYRKEVVETLKKAVIGRPNVRWIDPLDDVCTADYCPQVLHKIPVVIDSNHPSVAAAHLIGEHHRDTLEWLIR